MLSSSCRLVARSCAATSSPSSRARCSCSDFSRTAAAACASATAAAVISWMSRRSRRASSATRCACSSAVSSRFRSAAAASSDIERSWREVGFAGVGSTGRRLRFHASRCELSDGRSIGWRGGSFHDLTVDAAPKTVFDASRGSMIGAIFGVDDALCGTLRKCCGWSG